MYRKILIVKPSSLGDIVHSLAFLSSIKKEFPRVEIHWVVAKGLEGILDGHPLIARLFVVDKEGWKNPLLLFRTLKELISLGRELKKESYDAVVDLQGLFRSGLITWLSGCPVRVGFSDARELAHLFYNRSVEGGRAGHAVERYLKLARLLGVNGEEISFAFGPLSPSPVREGYFVVVPGARWPSKRWPTEYFIELLNMMVPSGLTPVIVGSREDISLSRAIVEGLRGRCINLAGKTDLRELCSVIRDARFMITNDSGPMHIGAALGVRVFAIFGPTDERLTGPYGEDSLVIKADGIDCRPCRKRVCKSMRCLYEIKPRDVYTVLLDSGALLDSVQRDSPGL